MAVRSGSPLQGCSIMTSTATSTTASFLGIFPSNQVYGCVPEIKRLPHTTMVFWRLIGGEVTDTYIAASQLVALVCLHTRNCLPSDQRLRENLHLGQCSFLELDLTHTRTQGSRKTWSDAHLGFGKAVPQMWLLIAYVAVEHHENIRRTLAYWRV